MKTSDFYYKLPESLIAQTPIKNRSESRLMIVNRISGDIEHRSFKNVIDYFSPGDCLVLNNTKVIPARLYGTTKQGATIEILLVNRIDVNRWEVLAKPGKKASIGTIISFGNDELMCTIEGEGKEGIKIIRFDYQGIFEEVLERLGTIPLPPYIKVPLNDATRYNTIYARHEGSIAAPTAGLHFTEEILDKLKLKGVSIAYLTLHVGIGTFRPVRVDKVDDHEMHSEFYNIDSENAQIINQAKKNGGRLIAVGTTSVRTLETIADGHGYVSSGSGWTDKFIYPGYVFKVVDGMITNFHLPESTLIMLVSAFSDRERILFAYNTAVQEGYRFFSFGDAMLII